jgi:hypothetical protein
MGRTISPVFRVRIAGAGAGSLSHRLGYPLQVALVPADYREDYDLMKLVRVELPDPPGELLHQKTVRLYDEEILRLLVDLSLPEKGGSNLGYVDSGRQPLLDDEPGEASGAVRRRRAYGDHMTRAQ